MTETLQPDVDTRPAARDPHVVYCLISRVGDPFAEMVQVSATMVRSLHPAARVSLLVDRATRDSLHERSAGVLDLIDKTHVVAPPDQPPSVRAWHMKAMAREVVTGDFLYLDGDALPIRRLDPLFQGGFDLAAVLDRNLPARSYKMPRGEVEVCQKMNWKIPRYNFNAGVLLFKDTPGAHALAKEWASRHLASIALGVGMDQHALSTAAQAMNSRVKILPHACNAQIVMCRSSIRRAVIVHFYTLRFQEGRTTVFQDMVQRLQETGKLDHATLDRFRETGYPWADENWISGQLAMGRYGKAARLMALKALGRKRRSDAAPSEAEARA